MKTEAPTYVLNAIRTPDGTVLRSRHRHDFQTHVDANGETYMVDGGLDYLKRSVNAAPYEELSMDSSAPFEAIREALEWGTYGKSGKDPLRYVKLSEMSNDHIQSILNDDQRKATKPAPSMEMHNDFREAVGLSTNRPEPVADPERSWLMDIFQKELEYREKNGIRVEDTLPTL